MKRVRMDMYDIIGDRADEAADYINARESTLTGDLCAIIDDGIGSTDLADHGYYEAMEKIKADAAETFGVQIKSWFAND